VKRRKRRKSRKRLLGGLALGAGAMGMVGTLLWKVFRSPGSRTLNRPGDVWARPGMQVTFRAELMPTRASSDRTFRILEVLPNNRVLLEGISGEHAENEFEPLRR
jgi:hypothetical protein